MFQLPCLIAYCFSQRFFIFRLIIDTILKVSFKTSWGKCLIVCLFAEVTFVVLFCCPDARWCVLLSMRCALNVTTLSRVTQDHRGFLLFDWTNTLMPRIKPKKPCENINMQHRRSYINETNYYVIISLNETGMHSTATCRFVLVPNSKTKRNIHSCWCRWLSCHFLHIHVYIFCK